jgi:hypothetical protein
MKWSDDDLRDYKYLVLDAIVKFSQSFEGTDFSNISIKNVHDFVDDFFKKKFLRVNENQEKTHESR